MEDAYSMWERQERRNERRLEERPVCSNCDKRIQDERAYYINDEWICPNCMETDFKKDVEDY